MSNKKDETTIIFENNLYLDEKVVIKIKDEGSDVILSIEFIPEKSQVDNDSGSHVRFATFFVNKYMEFLKS